MCLFAWKNTGRVNRKLVQMVTFQEREDGDRGMEAKSLHGTLGVSVPILAFEL